MIIGILIMFYHNLTDHSLIWGALTDIEVFDVLS